MTIDEELKEVWNTASDVAWVACVAASDTSWSACVVARTVSYATKAEESQLQWQIQKILEVLE